MMSHTMESLAKTTVLLLFSEMMLVVLPGLEARRLEVEESAKAPPAYLPIIASCAPKLPKNCGDEALFPPLTVVVNYSGGAKLVMMLSLNSSYQENQRHKNYPS
ncbi:hypothetical protein Tsubulata_044985 [Turnera subulata]|uniref:Uncharacterized protein n=1 Tax=Turnera subulata TaxID=218843 RepID=A0A9Q0G1M6_9ROSI|nr:hypothetical protein Tsubulata_044985 [Turnera subulata]